MKDTKAVKSEALVNATMPISMKDTKNVGRWIKKDKLNTAITKLEKVLTKEIAMPVVVHRSGIGPRKGIGPGKYPLKVSKFIVKMLKELKANARVKGLDETKLVINEFIPNMAISKEHRGKYQTGQLTHLKIGVVVEK
ncbi:50S ribosomal protein L22 [Candidatus Tiddalikarchaeum anstoanum]|nr:50S ribosomal protein L22 [Candidatus Tiddalikarchaeum anstoanum]